MKEIEFVRPLTESSYFTFTNVLSLWPSLHPMLLVVCTQFSCTAFVEFPGSLCFWFLIFPYSAVTLFTSVWQFSFILLHWISAKKMPSWELQIFCNNLQLWFKGILQLTNVFLVFHLFFLTIFDLAVSLLFSYWPQSPTITTQGSSTFLLFYIFLKNYDICVITIQTCIIAPFLGVSHF